MAQNEIRELNEEILNSFFERKYLICELKYHRSTTPDVYLFATNIGFVGFNNKFYPYEEFICNSYIITRIWVTYDISLIKQLRTTKSIPDNVKKIIESENLELVYSRESTKEDKEKTDNIINKYGLVT